MPLPDAIRWTLIVWLTVLGGCIGSFLNVVVYRLPRGQSLMHPGSRCPRCGHAIRWWHNLPVLGWLMLRGRCFDCGEPIAARYPIVEAIVAFWFGALAWYGPLSAQASDALDAARFWNIYPYHLFLCSVLLCLMLIDWDSQLDNMVKYPTKLWVIALLVGICVPIYDPRIHPIADWSAPDRLQGLMGGVLGALIGFAGCATWFASSVNGFVSSANGTGKLRSAHSVLHGTGQMVLIGAFLGWVAMAVIGAASVGGAVFARTRAGNSDHGNPPARIASAMQLVGVTICVLAWKTHVGQFLRD